MKPRVLMIAYACDPKGTGEHWLGWGWVEQAARSYEVELITTPKSQANVAERAREIGITPHFVGLSERATRLSNLGGKGGSWLRKILWQAGAARLAETLHRQNPFALVHQTTFHTFRVPFLAQRLGIPSVWGPVAGGESIPPGFSRYLGNTRFFEFSRKLVNHFWLHVPSVKKSLRQASRIFVSNRTTLEFLPAAVRGKCRLVTPNALRPEDEAPPAGPPPARFRGPTLQLLYVGNCVATRSIPLVFDALVASDLVDYKFSIVGAGPAIPAWKKMSAKLGLADKVEFVGKVPYDTLPARYAAADVLVFPALRDSGGSALLEAMSRGLPVLCLDWGGPGEMLDENSGLKIPVKSREATIKDLGAALVRLQRDPALGPRLAAAARQRAYTMFRWESKYQLLRTTYEELLKKQ
jgi:glycosyltransferase involved in cell wall biosynthesis